MRFAVSECASDADASALLDHAVLRIHGVEADYILLTQSLQCYECPLVSHCGLSPGSVAEILVNTTFPTRYAIGPGPSAAGDHFVCEGIHHFNEHGNYTLHVKNSNCDIEVNSNGSWSNKPILVAFVIYLLLAVTWTLGGRIWRSLKTIRRGGSQSYSVHENERTANEPDPSARDAAPSKKSARLKSLDTFRGLSIVIMIFVNYGGGGYWFFNHSPWNGLTVADLVFPWFMFIMGTSMVFAFQGSLKRTESRAAILANVLRRSLTLFGLGILLNSGGAANVNHLRIPGVLQRFGIAYLVVGGMRAITVQPVYNTNVNYDPEGTLGCLTSIFIVFLGLQAGQIILTYKTTLDRVGRWLVWAVVTGLIAGILCKFSKEDGWIPVNKNLWSVSFVLTTGSFAFFLLSAMYLLIDDRRLWNGAPLRQAGMNSIALYLGHEILEGYLPFSWQPLANTHAGHLAQDLWGATLWTAIAGLMDCKGVYVSV